MNPNRFFCLLFAGIVVSMVVLCLAVRHWWWDSTDLGHKPPAVVWKHVFRAQMPGGIHNFRAAGEFHLSGIVWMKFHAKDVDRVVQSFLYSKERKFSRMGNVSPYIPAEETVKDSTDAQSVDWSQAFEVPDPECFKFTYPDTYGGWYGVVILDRKHKTFYVHGELF